MKNQKIILGIVAVVVILGAGVYTLSQKSSQSGSVMPTDNNAMMKKDEGAMDDNQTMKNDDQRYSEYTKAALDGADDNRRVLFFYASWCPTCIPVDADLKASASKIPADVSVIRVNYNDPETDQEEKDLAHKYGITYQHTFVQIDKQGNEVTKWNGGKTAELLANIK